MTKLFLRNIKKGFATNSSSYHSTLILTKDEYEKWSNNEITIEGVSYSDLDGEYGDDGIYRYIESQAEREIDGNIIVAVTYCEDNE